MKSKMTLLIICLLTMYTMQAQTYQLNVDSSTCSWTGQAAFQAYSLSGTLSALSGYLEFDEGALTSAHVVMDMLSLSADNAQLETHLRSADFFEVEAHPTATFALSHVDRDRQQYSGSLTIKRISRPYDFALEVDESEDGYVVSGRLEIDRTQFGITFNSPTFFEKVKDQAIADTFVLDLRLVFVEKNDQ